MKKILSSIFIALIGISLIAQQDVISDKLSKKWEASGELKVPESVFYDDLNQVIYVSSMGEDGKDNSGFLSKLSTDGKIISLKWITDLQKPKGIGVIGNLLYVTEINHVAEIDIKAGKITRKIEISGAKFLNDIATDAQGNVYVSDSQDGAIYLIRQGKAELLSKSDQLEGINGLYVSEGVLLAGLKNKVVKINLQTKEISDYILNTGGIDGLVPDGKGNFLISDWQGTIHLINPAHEKVVLTDTKPSKVNAADIDYIISKKLLLVPTFSTNKVVAYEMQ
jgi:DNA-binding beta-propeller fold protein YncE